MRCINLFVKRIFDIVSSFIAMIILFPVLIIIGVCIGVSSKGPIIFKQERIGKRGKKFKIYKFRTMINNAEKLGSGIVVESEEDLRITKIGKFLRRTSLDELPQLLNVFWGSMSIVGPRPPVTYHPYNGYENYPEWIKNRFQVRPGITGLAQVLVRNDATWEERFKIDNEYVSNFNIFLDLKIMFNTIKLIGSKKNIY